MIFRSKVKLSQTGPRFHQSKEGWQSTQRKPQQKSRELHHLIKCISGSKVWRGREVKTKQVSPASRLLMSRLMMNIIAIVLAKLAGAKGIPITCGVLGIRRGAPNPPGRSGPPPPPHPPPRQEPIWWLRSRRQIVLSAVSDTLIPCQYVTPTPLISQLRARRRSDHTQSYVPTSGSDELPAFRTELYYFSFVVR